MKNRYVLLCVNAFGTHAWKWVVIEKLKDPRAFKYIDLSVHAFSKSGLMNASYQKLGNSWKIAIFYKRCCCFSIMLPVIRPQKNWLVIQLMDQHIIKQDDCWKVQHEILNFCSLSVLEFIALYIIHYIAMEELMAKNHHPPQRFPNQCHVD